jgi:hypothetical protein
MEFFTYINWFAAMVAAMMVTALSASWVSAKAIQGQRRIEATMRERFALLDRNFGALCASTSHAGDQIVSIEQHFRDLAARQECLETTGPMSLHYRQAQALLAPVRARMSWFRLAEWPVVRLSSWPFFTMPRALNIKLNQ